jgi:hypothetical protein
MSHLTPMSAMNENEVCRAIAAAMAEGVRHEPELAATKVVDRLQAAFGPIVQKIVAIIEAGATNLPAILEALKATGVVLPPWVNLIATILIAVMKQQ